MPVTTFGIPSMPSESGFFFTTSEIEDLERGVIRGCDKFRVVGTESYVSNWITMALYKLHVVEVRLPILDHAVVVS